MSFFDRALRKVTGKPAPLRGRVHKVSVVRGGEVSVVVRFGIEEPHARQLNQGDLLELDVVGHEPPPKRKSGQPAIIEAAPPAEPTP